ncbi:hypothetical protein DdX_15979 [Ditylenchus destructor]|uniref:Uncharacterized protein n=1 Tax=Ditylenchus destructor TaxID=166010 RepID=A0AAD4QUB0_9BILA|nr:hypothetical protein DdX_15979 [Ditylenchus destructor]
MNSNVLLAFSGISLIFLLQTNFINADGGDEGPGGDDNPDEGGPGLDEGPPNPDPNNNDMLVGPDDSRMDQLDGHLLAYYIKQIEQLTKIVKSMRKSMNPSYS